MYQSYFNLILLESLKSEVNYGIIDIACCCRRMYNSDLMDYYKVFCSLLDDFVNLWED